MMTHCINDPVYFPSTVLIVSGFLATVQQFGGAPELWHSLIIIDRDCSSKWASGNQLEHRRAFTRVEGTIT